jgi:serine protease Do
MEMNKRILLMGAGIATLSVGLIALPTRSATRASGQDDAAKLEEKLQKVRPLIDDEAAERALQVVEQKLARVQELGELQEPDTQDLTVMLGDEGASWLGVETQEVSSDFAKEHKLAAERGVVLGKIIADSPAAKAGLKENDVVTEVNGQRVEGTAQFRRMIREIPAGRTAQLTILRDGRSQTIPVTLGKAEQGRRVWSAPAMPGTFAFRVPDVPEMPEVMEFPRGGWGEGFVIGGRPRLGIDAEDLNGALGNFFGAPDGEGILVRDVNAGSPAEKAGLKAGDVITSLNGERIRTVGELREKLSAKRDEKGTSVKVGVLRNKSEISLTVELPAPAPRTKHKLMHRTTI